LGAYVGLGNELVPSKAYTVLALLNLLAMPLRMIVFVIIMYFNSITSMKRISHFIRAEEIKPDVV